MLKLIWNTDIELSSRSYPIRSVKMYKKIFLNILLRRKHDSFPRTTVRAFALEHAFMWTFQYISCICIIIFVILFVIVCSVLVDFIIIII